MGAWQPRALSPCTGAAQRPTSRPGRRTLQIRLRELLLPHTTPHPWNLTQRAPRPPQAGHTLGQLANTDNVPSEAGSENTPGPDSIHGRQTVEIRLSECSPKSPFKHTSSSLTVRNGFASSDPVLAQATPYWQRLPSVVADTTRHAHGETQHRTLLTDQFGRALHALPPFETKQSLLWVLARALQDLVVTLLTWCSSSPMTVLTRTWCLPGLWLFKGGPHGYVVRAPLLRPSKRYWTRYTWCHHWAPLFKVIPLHA